MKAKFTFDNNNIKSTFRLNNPTMIITRDEFDTTIGVINNEIISLSNTIQTYGDIVTYNAADFATSAQGALADTALQPEDNITELVNNAGYITGINDADIINALGYIPYDSSNPSGYTSNNGTVTSVNNINPIDGNVTLSIPTVPTNISAFINDSGYITASALNGYATEIWVTNKGYLTSISSSDVTTALGYTPYNSTNPSGYITSTTLAKLDDTDITKLSDGQFIQYKEKEGVWVNIDLDNKMVETALGYVPYNSTNPNGYTSNIGTVTSVNNVQPDNNGNVEISISSIPNPAYGTSSTAAATVEKVVSIPEITTLNVGQIIVVQPSETSSVANSTIKLNNFAAYPMRYNGAAITTSTDSIVWSNAYPSQFVFDGTYWVFLGHGVDTNTTYTLNYSPDSGLYKLGTGSYVVTRYSLMMQTADMTWEKITDPNAKYSTATTKTVNTQGFRLGQLKYYSSTSNFATGATIPTNVVYDKAASVDMRYSTNCGATPGWTDGDYIYLVGTMGADGLFYLDTNQWWTNTLPSTNDGKLYMRVGLYVTTYAYSCSLLTKHPVFYHDGQNIKEYIKASTVDETWLTNYLQTKYGLTPIN